MKTEPSADSITIVTVTRGRPQQLARALTSVLQQDYTGPLSHLILVDDCQPTIAFLNRTFKPGGFLKPGGFPEPGDVLEPVWKLVNREPEEKSGPGRLARLWNQAVGLSRSRWISFLDDDNEYEPDHLSSLIRCAGESGCRAVHSWRKLFSSDGLPYLDPVWPWCRDRQDGRRAYRFLCEKGVFQPGSHVERDRVDPPDCPDPDPVRIVDTSEWLLRKSLLVKYPFCTEYSYQDWIDITCGDDKFLHKLLEERVEIACTRKATLKYYLGGFSNRFLAADTFRSWGD